MCNLWGQGTPSGTRGGGRGQYQSAQLPTGDMQRTDMPQGWEGLGRRGGGGGGGGGNLLDHLHAKQIKVGAVTPTCPPVQ